MGSCPYSVIIFRGDHSIVNEEKLSPLKMCVATYEMLTLNSEWLCGLVGEKWRKTKKARVSWDRYTGQLPPT